MYIDTHCHLTFEQYKDDRAMVIGNAKKAGVKQMITSELIRYRANLLLSSREIIPMQFLQVVGFHPYEASHNPDH